MNLRSLLTALTMASLGGLFGCLNEIPKTNLPPARDLESIKKRGRLVALCRYNATSYFTYKGRPMGYDYELLKRFAEYLNVDLEIRVPSGWDEMCQQLYSGQGDIIAANMTVTLDRAREVAFINHHSTSRQVLVQRLPQNWWKMKNHRLERALVRDPIQLIGKKVHVRRSSAYYQRLLNLTKEVGGGIEIAVIPEDMETEFLIRMVSEGIIDYTIADDNMVKGYQAFYKNIDTRTLMSFSQRKAWAVRKNSPKLLEAANKWVHLMKTQKDPAYYVLYNKYFKNRRAFTKRYSSAYLSVTGGGISPYDSFFKHYSKGLGWDWKLIASMAFQESRFNPKAKSWAGAVGVMQVIPATGMELGITNLEDPEDNIRCGIKLLKLYTSLWKDVEDRDERIKFTLASYNAGIGHIQDARRLAKKYGKKTNVWNDNVAEFVLKKSQKKYYFDEVVLHGYCRGEEPYNYVKNVLELYEIYQKFEDYMNEGPVPQSSAKFPSPQPLSRHKMGEGQG